MEENFEELKPFGLKKKKNVTHSILLVGEELVYPGKHTISTN